MDAILNNPYRILGLLAGASAKDLTRQASRMSKFLAAEQELPVDDYSFPVLGRMNRTAESIAGISAKLNLDSDKVFAAMFWFYDGGNASDTSAFDALKQGNVEAAAQIWHRQVIETQLNGDSAWMKISEANYTAFHNYFVLALLSKRSNPVTAILANLLFMQSSFGENLIKAVTDITYTINKTDLQLMFLNEIVREIGNGNINTDLSKLTAYIKDYTFSAKDDFMKKISQQFVARITAQIEISRTARAASPSTAAKTGETLCEKTRTDLTELKSIVGAQDYNCTRIADELAGEILQCGTDYFNHHKERSDPSAAALKLFKLAKSVASGQVATDKCDKNIKDVQEWKTGEPLRKVNTEINFVASKLKDFQSLSDTIDNAKNFAVSCKPKLDVMKSVLGASDDFYMQVSSAVVNNAVGMLVTVVNKSQQNIDEQMQILGRNRVLGWMQTSISGALDVMNILSRFDMDSTTRTRFKENNSTLFSISNQISQANTGSSGYGSGGGGGGSTQKKKFCYIATMAYGSYEHPQVVILRQFRDQTLERYACGRWFIRQYYRWSPKLVEKMKNHHLANRIIRNILNQFIKLIK
ncbi:MAG: hypothetical protein LBD35_06530 [Prevotellaceae bacterium]|jgi:hypothetical protein|nr:hypothetical protein [Prevotellaceae bacterium]